MKKQRSGELLYSPSDLVRYVASPFASWMDRYHLENPGAITPDEETEDATLIAQTGEEHEQAVLSELKSSTGQVIEIPTHDFAVARAQLELERSQGRLPDRAASIC